MGADLAWPSERVLAFGLFLRESGFQIGPQEQRDFLRVLHAKPLTTLGEVQLLWRPIACHSKRDHMAWQDLFLRFWEPHRTRGTTKVSGQTKPSRNLQQRVEQAKAHDSQTSQQANKHSASGQTDARCGTGEDDTEKKPSERSMGGASTVDALHDRESQMWMPSDLNSLEQLARGIHRRLPQTRTRRWQSSIHGLKLDGRRTLRKSASLLGDSLIPCWKRRRREPIELILLNDVSRSMEAHAALALRTSRAFHRVMGARVFVFHLRPIEVTDLMRRDTPAVQERINAVTAGFQSGTRIADSIRALHSHRPSVSFNRRTRLWIFSDGFDTAPSDQLACELQYLNDKGVKVDWFYPTRQAPTSQAAKAASAMVSEWLPAHDFVSLRSSLLNLAF
ncbi:MAG: VWA domain-containing protein [Burkholderiaceae bacterium]|jgi:uncharacterized protein|nr:VWA domain-containing protein [Burkholderiaceae bacterium]MDP4829839.1 VWA domain-containing protein [Burkholderiaceae bacterium]MDP4920263.1 VWA domain-containing protein [Burkholderiaceae bacterium]HCO57285.1 hypothetical protein [Burkholderiales bacterium]